MKLSYFTVQCNDTARQKELQERSCEIFLIYFDSGSSLSWEEIELASSHSANHGQHLSIDVRRPFHIGFEGETVFNGNGFEDAVC